ncbi:lysM and putative peptidoglycan-binding domain-containing protein 1 [Micropterus dolomieu]|uniref:lysM and putative peptidoglycan-binding domain-containing protein 1 n=1 Tax=Micropterus dolomieu TaxID=147949 RepID=UPI001E8CD3E3|nr:lysM and putative peptidoglycan-binding domain-containing protein 1 [Micropterus dolomieu]XP_045899747.1 lysM and putative peptidoglycan-binding domain-containing protein 1 [Micropterus dolomieu]XP_045899748.1 lysM and putative peptidoglycan-binding domain-containing protein 1 [Micropterus dolomieu]
MSGERAPLPNGGNGLLRGSRTRSYGSLIRSPLSPVRQRRIEHKIQPGETLQGLALKYGVSMEQIKRANRMYTNDSIFLKKSLSIPVLSDMEDCSNGGDLALEDSEEDSAEKKQDDGQERASDLNPVDFLKRLDGLISQSKQAAVKGCQEAEKRVAALEAACTRTSDLRPLTRSQSVISSSRMQQQQPAHVAVPLTITKLTKRVRDREDEMFQL